MKKLFIAVQGAAKNAHLGACYANGEVQAIISVGPLTPKVCIDFKISLQIAFDRLAKKLGFPKIAGLVENSESLAVAMSGVFQPCDEYAILQNLRDFGFAVSPVICEDVWAVLAAEGYNEGAVVMASTGAIVFIRNESGASLTVGGWGSDIADQGSGFEIGMLAIRRVLEHMDGRRDLPKDFIDEVLSSLNLTSISQIIPWYHEVRRTSYWRPKIADLAEVVVNLAENKNEQNSKELLLQGIIGLESSLKAAFRRASENGLLPRYGEFPVVLAGGLGVASRTYAERIGKSLEQLGTVCSAIRLSLVISRNHPIAGALALAVTKAKRLPEIEIVRKIQSDVRRTLS